MINSACATIACSSASSLVAFRASEPQPDDKPRQVKKLHRRYEENALKAMPEKTEERHSHSIVLGGLELMS